MEENKEKGKLRQFFDLSEVFGYYFKKKDANKKVDLNTRMMHGMNRIAIIVFLLAMLYFVVKKIL